MKRAIIIGLTYKGSPYALPDCHLDAAEVTRRAEAAGYKCQTVTGTFSADDFIAEMARLRSVSKASDSTLIAYSGHGTQWYDPAGGEPDRQEEGLCFWNGDDIDVLPDNDFRKMMDETAGMKFVLFDSCYSGGMERAAAGRTFQRRWIPFSEDWAIVRRAKASRSAKGKLYCMFASAKNEVSWSTGVGGLFTMSFCEGYDRHARAKRNIRTVMDYAAGLCGTEQTPNYRIFGGNARKLIF